MSRKTICWRQRLDHFHANTCASLTYAALKISWYFCIHPIYQAPAGTVCGLAYSRSVDYLIESVLLMATFAFWPPCHDPVPSIKALHYLLLQNMNHKWNIDLKNHKLLYLKKKHNSSKAKLLLNWNRNPSHLKGTMRFKDFIVIKNVFMRSFFLW